MLAVRTRFYEEFNMQLLCIDTQAGHLQMMLTRKQKDRLIDLLKNEEEGVITNDI